MRFQANKNWMVKARVGSASAAAAIGLRAWFHPSFLLFGSVQYNYGSVGGTAIGGSGAAVPSWTRLGDLPLRWGLVLQIENFGAMRYERGSQVRGCWLAATMQQAWFNMEQVICR